jgi:DNA-binding MarR family transcriptional regulator
MQKRTAFESLHQDQISGKLTLPDRVIFKGYLGFREPKGMGVFLSRLGVLLKDFGKFAKNLSAALKAHAEKVADEAGRPFIYLDSPHTARSGHSKEQLARDIAERDGVREGLICVLSVLEPCGSFDVRGNRKTRRLGIVYRRRKCLHFYFYFFDPEFGFMHVRLQSWLPLSIQIYVNGREWLCRKLDEHGVGYERYDNALVRIDDMPTAQRLARRFMRRRWPRALDRFARFVNPWLLRIARAGFGGYYWVTDQCEIATDLMFKSRAALSALMPDLLEHSLLALSAEDALRFLARKPSARFLGEATADLKRRPEGFRVKFRMKRNSIKMYDKGSVLRIETTIYNPREFKVRRPAPGRRRRRSLRWMPMAKGVANFWSYGQVGEHSNARFLNALANAHPKRQAIAQLDRLCSSRTVCKKRIARFNPVADKDARLFAIVLAGHHLLNGFRNRDLAALLPHPPRSKDQARRLCERISRLIAKLRGHGLVAKVPRSRLYRVTPLGQRLMAAAISYRHDEFASALLQAA